MSEPNILPIPETDGYYADANGNVYSSWRRFRKPSGYGTVCRKIEGYFYKLIPRTEDGYQVVSVKHTGKKSRRKMIHQAVLEAHGFFRTSEKNQVRHLNGDRSDNRLENLMWGTPQENGNDTAAHGTLKGIKNPSAKLNEEEVRFIRNSKIGSNTLARMFGMARTKIWAVRTGRTYTEVV